MKTRRPLVYLAGPLFTPAERRWLEELAGELERLGLDTYLPHRDAGLAPADRRRTRAFYRADLRALDRAAAIVAVVDGPDVDAGTAFEIGYGAARGLPIVGVAEDVRLEPPKARLNVMIGNACSVIGDHSVLRQVNRLIARGRPRGRAGRRRR